MTMGKGDGKKKRKKKDNASSGSPGLKTPEASSPPPMRVSNAINIPIRRQISYGRMNKQMRQSGSMSFRQSNVRTKYRRTWDEEEIEQKKEERRRKGQDPDWDIVLNQTTASPLVIVDGYNIIYKWPRLKKHMLKGDTSRARQILVDDLESLRSLKGWRIEVVFDGAGRNFKSGPLGDTRQRRATAADKAASKDISKFGVRTVYTGSGIEADTYIEGRCAEAKNVTNGSKTGTFIVATVRPSKSCHCSA
jgi:predicted RNA-binding protein with PIN domain